MTFEYKFTSHRFDSPGYLLCDVPDCVRDEILDIITTYNIENDKCDLKDAREFLTGHLEKEYHIPITPNIKYLVESMSFEYDKIFNHGEVPSHKIYYSEKIKGFNYQLKSLWINYSKKYDFNPIHTHTGSYSFVIWVKIPYDLKEEMERYSPNFNSTSLFSFHYVDIFGSISKIKLYIDKTWEWKMAFFPANLNHSVNPFYTSDEYRISVSGNVFCFPEYDD